MRLEENAKVYDNFPDYLLSDLAGFMRVREVLPGRFFRKVRFAESGCWIWIGSTWGPPKYPSHKYGQTVIWNSETKTKRRICAHKFAYETIHGPVPSGHELDHLCEVKLCVNPNHLEVVTHAVNCQRRNNRGNGHRFNGGQQ